MTGTCGGCKGKLSSLADLDEHLEKCRGLSAARVVTPEVKAYMERLRAIDRASSARVRARRNRADTSQDGG